MLVSVDNKTKVWTEDIILKAFPEVNNGLMETDGDLIRSLEAVSYITVADLLRKIYKHSDGCETNDVSKLVVWIKSQGEEINNFANFADFLETRTDEICELFKYWLWPTLSYLKIYDTPYGKLDLEENFEAVLALLGKSSYPGLDTLLIDCREFGYLPHLIDYIQQVANEAPRWEVFDLTWDDFLELLDTVKDRIRNLLDTESNRWLYN